ncbi:MAG: LPS export ABC transporter periplasmic protein LptC [Leptolyngbyaceae cyanobacterium]
MSRLFWLRRWLYPIILGGIVTGLVACGGNEVVQEATDADEQAELTSDLVFNNVTLEQSDDQGLLLWRMIADRATYSQDRRDAVIEMPSGEIFQADGPADQAAFSVEAQEGEVRQNGERLFLRGDVVVTDEETGAVIRGNEMRWVPDDNTIVLRGNVRANHPEFKMTAQRVIVSVDEDLVEIQGNVKAETTDGSLLFNGESVNWFLAEERFESDRPVRFQQRDGETIIGRAQGNQVTYDIATQIATLTDDAIVVAQDPPIRISGNALEWDKNKNTVAASERVTVFHRVENVTLVADEGLGTLDDQVFVMTGNVVVTATQNQARLRSDELTWTVSSQRVVAEGNVVYRQADPIFNLRGPRAVGRLEDETIVVSGGRVVTEVIPDS